MKSAWAVLLLGPTLLTSLPESAPADGPVVYTRNQRRDLLATIHQARSQLKPAAGPAGAELAYSAGRQVIDLHSTFQEMPAGRGSQVRFARAFLGADGAGFDAIRFRTPATGENFQLRFELVVPGNGDSQSIRGWNILALTGEIPPFSSDALRREDFELPGVGLPDDNVCFTQALATPLAPATEYLIWFDLKSTEPVAVFVKVRLAAASPPDPPHNLTLQKAKAAYESGRAAIEKKYDADRAALGQSYAASLTEALATAPAAGDPAERPRIAAELEEIRRSEAAATGHRGFRVVRAGYGVDDRWVDVTKQVRALVRGDSLRFRADQERFKPDPAFGTTKTLMIIYSLDGNLGASITREGQTVELPPTSPATDRIPPAP